MSAQSISKILGPLLKDLSDRQREVLSGRFGLEKPQKIETLEALGKRFGVTRERVRQIEASALGALKTKLADNPQCTELLDAGKKQLKVSGGVLKRDLLIRNLREKSADINDNHLGVLLAASNAFDSYEEDANFWPFYHLEKTDMRSAANFIDQWVRFVKSQKDTVLAGSYDPLLKQFIRSKGVNPSHAQNYLNVSKKFHTNPYGDTGLREWGEIHPKTIRDRIYLILKKQGSAVHFATIAELINKAKFDKRVALASTVHNELIKDDRFVLVGRGMYALAEHGYEPGTARDVIQKILKRQGALPSKAIVLAVQKERFLKENTILVNLQNKSFFERRPDGVYRIRES